MNCQDFSELMHADLDNQLDLPTSVTLAEHRSACPECRARFQQAAELRDGLRQRMAYHRAPAALRARLQQLGAEPAAGRKRTWLNSPALTVWPKTAAAFATLMLAVGLGWQLGQQAAPAPLADAVIAGHVRSLLADHLTDVASSDQHTVKPWFNGKLDFSPRVVDLTEHGFPLVGGRLDYLDGRPVAALVYRRRQHLVNVFIWPSGDGGAVQDYRDYRHGYNLLAFNAHGMNYWLVADLNAKELGDLRQLLAGPAQ